MRNHFGLLLFAAVSAACSANQPPAKSGHNAPDSAEQSPAAQAGGEDNRLVAWGFAQGKKALREGRANDAVQFFTGVVDRRPEHAWANHFLGVSLEQAGDKTRAIGKYRTALKLDPRVSNAAVNLSALLLEQDRYQEAAEILRKAIEQVPSDARLHANLGSALAHMQQQEAAQDEYAVALNLAKDLSLRLQVASMLAHGGERKSARKVYMEVVASEQAGPDVLLKAAAGLLDMGEPNACLTACEAALRREKSPAAFVQRSRCRLSAGDEADATKDLRHALSLDPRHAPAQFYLAELHLANGNKKEALDAYKRCAMLAPDTPLALRAKERMREAQSGNAARR